MAALNDEQEAFLGERRYAVLATINLDGSPQQSTMWYEYDGPTILMNTKAGRVKDRNLRRDSRVSFCVEDGERYLTVRGRVTLDDDPEIAQRDARRLAVRYNGVDGAERMMRDQFSKERRVTIRLSIDKVHPYGF